MSVQAEAGTMGASGRPAWLEQERPHEKVI
jgi:hypothetical protein